MPTAEYSHTPVLLKEVLGYLGPKPGENFVDATLGGGGYTRAILERTAPKGKVLAIDLDSSALDNFKSKSDGLKDRVVLCHGNFADINKFVTNHEFGPIAGIVADIGLSSFQLDHSGRGITFQKKEPLDMRFDLSSDEPDAKFILNNHSETELAEIFRKYGEEPNARAIARKIVRERDAHKVHYTTDLLALIEAALPKPIKHKVNDVARRIFQSLRIVVNHELQNLETFLPKALDIVAPGGVIAVITFHSLEDRIVKQFFVESARGCVCPLEFPICLCGKNPSAKILTKKPVTASEEELQNNSRSKPAKLRVITKTNHV